MTRIGIAAHDSAASEGGPRYNSELTHEQRKALENGAHLCPTCALLVDADSGRFPEGTLREWQKNAMDSRYRQLHTPAPPTGLNYVEACGAAKLFLQKCRPITFDTFSGAISWVSMAAMEDVLRATAQLNPGNSLWAQFPHMVNIQLQIIDAIRAITDEVKNSGSWYRSDDMCSYLMKQKQTIFPSAEEERANEAIAASLQVARLRMEDIQSLMRNLSQIINSPYQTNALNKW